MNWLLCTACEFRVTSRPGPHIIGVEVVHSDVQAKSHICLPEQRCSAFQCFRTHPGTLVGSKGFMG